MSGGDCDVMCRFLSTSFAPIRLWNFCHRLPVKMLLSSDWRFSARLRAQQTWVLCMLKEDCNTRDVSFGRESDLRFHFDCVKWFREMKCETLCSKIHKQEEVSSVLELSTALKALKCRLGTILTTTKHGKTIYLLITVHKSKLTGIPQACCVLIHSLWLWCPMIHKLIAKAQFPEGNNHTADWPMLWLCH